jgi:molybdate-binding protein
MLMENGVEPAGIKGYRTEEFTHAAVAATVASGGADVGLGVRAAAAEYRLAFVPLVRERYFLRGPCQGPAISGARSPDRALQSATFQRIVHRLPGYHAVAPGTVLGLDGVGVVERKRPIDKVLI